MASTTAVLELKKYLYDLATRFINTLRKPVPANLLDLPLELHIQILSRLEWHEVLRVRQTCRHLHNASMARPIWLALYKLYSATVYPRRFCLEKPLDLYTNRELEHLILRWQKSRIYCSSNEYKTMSIQRQFTSPEEAHNCSHLVEGGRWLLVGTTSGSVICYDLNTSTIEPAMLIPMPFDEDVFDEDAETEILLSIDMDLDVEYLTFNLGIIVQREPARNLEPSQSPRYFRWIQIWRVSSDVDQDGEVKGLRADQLACFPEAHQNQCDSFRLRGTQVAYALYTRYELSDSRNGPCIIIVDWTVCNSVSLEYPRKVIWRSRAEWLALLPGNRLLRHHLNEFRLFELDVVPMTTLDPSQYHRHFTQTSKPAAELSLFAQAISHPYLLPHSTRISVLMRYGVSGIVIRADSQNPIEQLDHLSHATPLNRFYNPPDAHIGYDHVLIPTWAGFMVVQHAWPENPACSSVAEKSIDWPTGVNRARIGKPKILFDELSGQIALSIHNGNVKLLLGVGNS